MTLFQQLWQFLTLREFLYVMLLVSAWFLMPLGLLFSYWGEHATGAIALLAASSALQWLYILNLASVIDALRNHPTFTVPQPPSPETAMPQQFRPVTQSDPFTLEELQQAILQLRNIPNLTSQQFLLLARLAATLDHYRAAFGEIAEKLVLADIDSNIQDQADEAAQIALQTLHGTNLPPRQTNPATGEIELLE